MMISLVWICIVCFALDEINVSTADELETPSCTVKWVEVHDVYSLGATFQLKETLKECREACIQRVPGCTAVDVHGNFTNCFTHTQSLSKLEKSRIPYKGYTQLVLTKECASTTLPPPAQTTVQSSTEAVQSNPQSSTKTDKSESSSSTAGTDKISTIPNLDSTTSRPTDKMSTIGILATTKGTGKISTIGTLADTKGTDKMSTIGTLATTKETDKMSTIGTLATTKGTDKMSTIGTLATTKGTDKMSTIGTLATTKGTDKMSTIGILATTKGTGKISTIKNVVSTPRTDRISTTATRGIGLSGVSTSQPVPPADCRSTEKWIEYKNSYTSTGSVYSAVRGSDACKKACVEEIPGCVAVVYNVDVGVCWYHDEVVDFDKIRKSGKDFYLYVRQGGCRNIKPAKPSDSLLHLQLGLG